MAPHWGGGGGGGGARGGGMSSAALSQASALLFRSAPCCSFSLPFSPASYAHEKKRTSATHAICTHTHLPTHAQARALTCSHAGRAAPPYAHTTRSLPHPYVHTAVGPRAQVPPRGQRHARAALPLTPGHTAAAGPHAGIPDHGQGCDEPAEESAQPRTPAGAGGSCLRVLSNLLQRTSAPKDLR